MFPPLVDACRTCPPRIALVLGSKPGAIAQLIWPRFTVACAAIPDLAATSVDDHRGCLSVGDWGRTVILLFEGRLHYYQGYPWAAVIQPVHLARFCARILILTNSAGGFREDLGVLERTIDWLNCRF